METFRKYQWTIGLAFIGVALLLALIKYVLLPHHSIFAFIILLIAAIGILMVVSNFFFDNEEYEANTTLPGLVKKIRYRALLFNNISIAVFVATMLVIITGFYFLVKPTLFIDDNVFKNSGLQNLIQTSLTIQISASVLLIFLVQILFRVFKYLLRVAAFYNGKADAIEFHKLKPEINLEKFMDLFTPDKYDISDLQNPSVTETVKKKVKE